MRAGTVDVIGGGIAGSEAALTLAGLGIKVRLIECRPAVSSPAHVTGDYAELVCSNSLKSSDVLTAHGLLKAELSEIGCYLLDIAEKCRVPAGSALAVDRKAFSALVTEKIKSSENVEIVNEVASKVSENISIVATGPLTLPPLSEWLERTVGEKSLHFFDAEAPIISAESVDMTKAYYASRYDKGDGSDYLNCPLSKEEYEIFLSNLLSAERAIEHVSVKKEIFEGCMPVEIMAARGADALRFGPMKPVGLRNPVTGERAFAVVQLRKENARGDMLNMVGFQTNLKFGEQKRVFGLIPALKNAEFLRYGVMHRNTFIDGPKVLDGFFRLKTDPRVFIAGQLSGVEGYVESIASGKVAALTAAAMLAGKEPEPLPLETMIGALAGYVSFPSDGFQPMNANYGLLPPLDKEERDKTKRKQSYYDRSIASLRKYLEKRLWN